MFFDRLKTAHRLKGPCSHLGSNDCSSSGNDFLENGEFIAGAINNRKLHTRTQD